MTFTAIHEIGIRKDVRRVSLPQTQPPADDVKIARPIIEEQITSTSWFSNLIDWNVVENPNQTFDVTIAVRQNVFPNSAAIAEEETNLGEKIAEALKVGFNQDRTVSVKIMQRQ